MMFIMLVFHMMMNRLKHTKYGCINWRKIVLIVRKIVLSVRKIVLIVRKIVFIVIQTIWLAGRDYMACR